MASSLTGADIIARSLEAHNVEHVFATPGEHASVLLDAVQHTGNVRIVRLRSEAATVMAADAYARVSGRPGVAFVSHGAGAS